MISPEGIVLELVLAADIGTQSIKVGIAARADNEIENN